MPIVILGALVFAIVGLVLDKAMAEQATPLEQALSSKLQKELNDGMACSVDLVKTRAALDAAQAKIKELEASKDTPK